LVTRLERELSPTTTVRSTVNYYSRIARREITQPMVLTVPGLILTGAGGVFLRGAGSKVRFVAVDPFLMGLNESISNHEALHHSRSLFGLLAYNQSHLEEAYAFFAQVAATTRDLPLDQRRKVMLDKMSYTRGVGVDAFTKALLIKEELSNPQNGLEKALKAAAERIRKNLFSGLEFGRKWEYQTAMGLAVLLFVTNNLNPEKTLKKILTKGNKEITKDLVSKIMADKELDSKLKALKREHATLKNRFLNAIPMLPALLIYNKVIDLAIYAANYVAYHASYYLLRHL
jgi:hypothetical protein